MSVLIFFIPPNKHLLHSEWCICCYFSKFVFLLLGVYRETEELAIVTGSLNWKNLYVIKHQLTNEAEGPADDSSFCCGCE